MAGKDTTGITESSLKDQRDAICDNVAAYSFTFEFSRSKIEEKRLNDVQFREFKEKHERYARFSQFIVDVEPQEGGMGSIIYKVTVRLSPGEAVQLLENCISLTWRVSGKYKKIGRNRNEPSRGIRTLHHWRGSLATAGTPYIDPSVTNEADRAEARKQGKYDLPSIGDLSSDEQDKLRENLMDRHLTGADVEVSSEYQVKSKYEYIEGEIADVDDFYWVRKGLWHEIMETAIILIGTEAFCFPLGMYQSLAQEPTHKGERRNFAHDAVMAVQRGISDYKNWIGWAGDPPFDSWESQARTYEKEAKRLNEMASTLDRNGEHLRANGLWRECAAEWQSAAMAWDASGHQDARSKAKQARREMELASKKAGHWEVLGSGGKEIIIKYRDWFGEFEAEILDISGKRMDKFTQSIEYGEIRWGSDTRVKPGIYFVKVKLVGGEYEVKKAIILK